MKKSIFITFLMLLPMLASADNVEINGILYNLNAETRTAEVISKSSNSTTIYNLMYVDIPSQVNYNEVSYQVTAIGENAFRNISTLLEYISIPSSVTSIGSDAFKDCSELDRVNIEDITAWCNIQFANAAANPLYSARHLYLNGVEVTHVTFPNTMTSIQPWVFIGCINLTSVTIPTSVTKIGQGAFLNSGLTSVEIPSSVTMIEESAFQRCVKMVSVNIPNTLTSIEPNTFCECSSLTSISIPSSVKSIGQNAFFGCNKLEAVHIKDLSVWCKTQFRSFYSNPLGYAHHLYVDGKEVKDLVIPADVTEISDYAFYECDGLTSVTFPSHVTNIGTYSFQQCNGLTDIVIPSNVTEIQNCAFMSCENLKTVVIEEGVKVIGGAAFFQCSALNSIVIPNSVTTLGESSFCGCTAMNSATIGNSIKEIPRFVFGYCTALKELYCYAEDVPTVDKEGFAQTDIQNITLFVPIAAINAYQAVEPWKNFKEIVAKPAKGDYRPFVEDGKVWKVGEILSNPVQMVYYYYFDGDTIIDGKTCKQMMCQQYVSPEHPNYDDLAQGSSLNYVGAWYEEDKKVYFYDEDKQSMRMMYDFSLSDNESLYLFDDYPPFTIGPRKTGGIEYFKGIYRDIMLNNVLINQNIKNTTWLEGVGGIEGPTKNAFPKISHFMTELLMSCFIGDEVIYFNDEYEDGATPDGMNAKKRFDFTHTIKTQPKAPMRRVAEQSLYGEYNNLQLGINLNSIDDAYKVRITDKTGNVVYEKDIFAGYIVGLDIDISNYGEGRYTVTMENSHESFTGEFEVQTTGIEEVRNNHEMVRDYIYNLQGQRINSLQKGLNIVNGRKIYVK